MTRRRTLAAALLALFALGGAAPALAAEGPAELTTERVCLFLGSDPADRHGLCVGLPLPGR